MIQAPRGTKDVLPQESAAWQAMEHVMRETCRLAGYREIRTPVIEHTELFLRGVGDTTDVVQKEMYTFEDKGGRSITLKPEGTAARPGCSSSTACSTTPCRSRCTIYIARCFATRRPSPAACANIISLASRFSAPKRPPWTRR